MPKNKTKKGSIKIPAGFRFNYVIVDEMNLITLLNRNKMNKFQKKAGYPIIPAFIVSVDEEKEIIAMQFPKGSSNKKNGIFCSNGLTKTELKKISKNIINVLKTIK